MTVLATENSVVGRLELIRQALGMTVKEFAELCGISFQAYYSYLNSAYVPSIQAVSSLIKNSRKKRRTRNKITYQWVYDGDTSGLTHVWQRRLDLSKKTARLARMAARRLNKQKSIDIIQAGVTSSGGQKHKRGKINNAPASSNAEAGG